MRVSVWIVIALMLFGGVSAALSETGAYRTQVDTIPGISQSDMETLQENVARYEANPLSGLTAFPTVIRIVFGAIITALCIIPTLMSLGVPLAIAVIFQAPIWVIYAVEFASWWKGMTGAVS